jgi:hypothetical protein
VTLLKGLTAGWRNSEVVEGVDSGTDEESSFGRIDSETEAREDEIVL